MTSRFILQAKDGIRYVAVTGVQTCALPIYHCNVLPGQWGAAGEARIDTMLARSAETGLLCAVAIRDLDAPQPGKDRKSTRLNSSHGYISYAVFCLKKKKKNENIKDPAKRLY